MSKIDIDKFICNLFAQGALPKGSKERVYVENALYDCGLEYYGGEIVERKEEPKFKAGNWYQCTKDFFGKGVTFDKNTAYYCAKEGCLQNEYGCHIAIVKDLYDNFKLWSIQDAKDGDVLANDTIVLIVDHLGTFENRPIIYSWYFANSEKFHGIGPSEPDRWEVKGFIPATKEQRDLLFSKMKEAGYEWDSERKELKEIVDKEQIKKNLQDNSFRRMFEQKPTWSEEDEYTLYETIQHLEELIRIDKVKHLGCDVQYYQRDIDWLKSLKERMKGE